VRRTPNPVLSGVYSTTQSIAEETGTLDLSTIAATTDNNDPYTITISGIPSDAI
jgi:hypothetical protein